MMFRASEYDKALHEKACALAASILTLRETVASSIDNPASDKATIGQQLDLAIATAKKYIEAVVATLDDKKQFDKPLRECQQALKAAPEGASSSASASSRSVGNLPEINLPDCEKAFTISSLNLMNTSNKP